MTIRSFIRKRKIPLLAALLAALGLLICVLCAAPRVRSASAAARQVPIYSVRKADPVCSLTFDAAWENANLRQTKAKVCCPRGEAGR